MALNAVWDQVDEFRRQAAMDGRHDADADRWHIFDAEHCRQLAEADRLLWEFLRANGFDFEPQREA